MKLIISMFYILWSFFMNFISFFFNLDSKKVTLTSTHNNSFNFNSKALFFHLKHNDDFDVKYVIKDPIKRNELINEYGDFFIGLFAWRDIKHILSSRFWISSTFELPYLVIFKRRRRVNLHLGHGIPLKNIGLAEEKITLVQFINRKVRTRQFTDIICYSKSLQPMMENIFRNNKANFLSLGQPRNDNLKCGDDKREKFLKNINATFSGSKLVLYAPTWRPYKNTELFPFNDFDPILLEEFLTKSNTYLFVRSHPFYPLTFPKGFDFSERVIDFSSDIHKDISDILHIFDMLVTDYSSIYLDYLKIGKIGFIPYDFDKYLSEVGFSFDYTFHSPGKKIYSQKQFFEFIIEDDDYIAQRNSLAQKFNVKYSGNCEEIKNYLVELLVESK